MDKTKPIIAIDGPAGSGKSTIAKRVAKSLNLFYIDTGAMYRALALKVKSSCVPPQDEDRVIELAKDLDVRLDYNPSTADLAVWLDNQDVTDEIRKPYISDIVSLIAKIKGVRECMVTLQRRLAEGKKAILEGRDISTVVFPDAAKKFYLDADLKERIHRRYLELKDNKIDVDEEDVKEDINRRDRLDTTRKYAPLRRAPDAVYIDTTRMSIDEVVGAVLEEIKKTPWTNT